MGANLISDKLRNQQQFEDFEDVVNSSEEAIEGYIECPAFKERCLTDCIFPKHSPFLSDID